MLPLNASKPDASLGLLEYEIAKINIFPPERAPIYPSLEAASSGGDPVSYLQSGELLYVAYTSRADVNGNAYVYTGSGGGCALHQPAIFPSRVLYQQPPRTSFGWIVETTNPQIAPDYSAPEAGTTLTRESVVQIYDIVPIGFAGVLHGRAQPMGTAPLYPRAGYQHHPPEGVEGGRWIESTFTSRQCLCMKTTSWYSPH